MEAMYSKLESLAFCAVHRSKAKEYLSLMVFVDEKRERIVIIIDQGWTSFSTEDQQLLERLKADGVAWRKHQSSGQKYKYSHVFPGLTPKIVDEHAEDSRKLIEQSIELKLHRA